MSRPLFLVAPDQLDHAQRHGSVLLSGAEGRHAVSVRRIGAGEAIDLGDGRGRLAHGRVVAVSPPALIEVAVDQVDAVPAPHPRVTVVQALPKGDRATLAVELLTEVGVDVIVPWSAQRCIVRWDGPKAVAGRDRWQAVAREAGKQSRRAWLPEVADLADISAVCRLLSQASLGIVLHESAQDRLPSLPDTGDGGSRASGSPAASTPGGRDTLGLPSSPDPFDVVLVVGPEGGLNDEELARFREAGARPAVLGPTVMRTSTAGAVAAAILLARSQRWA